MTALVRPSDRTLAAGALVGAALLVAYVVVPDPVVQYGAWLFVFAVWMAWFVATSVVWLLEQ
jgi:hypothetical protein